MNDILTAMGIGRAGRRKLIAAQAKRLPPFVFEKREDLVARGPGWRSAMWASGVYWIQEKREAAGWRRAMIGRHDKKPGLTWKELQNIKNAVYGCDRWAVQCFPPDSEVTDVANIYWLFVAPEGWKPEWEVYTATPHGEK